MSDARPVAPTAATLRRRRGGENCAPSGSRVVEDPDAQEGACRHLARRFAMGMPATDVAAVLEVLGLTETAEEMAARGRRKAAQIPAQHRTTQPDRPRAAGPSAADTAPGTTQPNGDRQ